MSTPQPLHTAARRLATAGALVLLATATPLAAAPSAGAAGAKPQAIRCARLSGSALRRCRAQNAANKALLTQLKNSRLVGARGDGEAVDWLFCADGRYELRTGSDSVGISRGSRWTVEEAKARQGNRWLEGVVSAPGGLEVGVLRRGAQWQVAIASLGRMSSPGDVEKTPAGAACG